VPYTSAMKMILCAMLLAATLGCQSGSAKVEKLFGGPEAMAALRGPDSTQAWRTTAPFIVKEGTETKGKLADYVILRGPVPVKENISTAIAGLLQRDIYEWNMAKGCEPIPGVAIEYTKGADKLLIFFCFECDILLTYLNGNRVGGEDFDRIHRALANEVKKIFPNDPDIQKL